MGQQDSRIHSWESSRFPYIWLKLMVGHERSWMSSYQGQTFVESKHHGNDFNGRRPNPKSKSPAKRRRTQSTESCGNWPDIGSILLSQQCPVRYCLGCHRSTWRCLGSHAYLRPRKTSIRQPSRKIPTRAAEARTSRNGYCLWAFSGLASGEIERQWRTSPWDGEHDKKTKLRSCVGWDEDLTGSFWRKCSEWWVSYREDRTKLACCTDRIFLWRRELTLQYEGQSDIHALILGRAITGIQGFV